MDNVISAALDSFEKAGRAIERVATIELGERSGASSVIKQVTGGKMHADRIEIVVAAGPRGREVLTQPMSGGAALPGELHLRLPGALRAPARYGESGLVGTNWTSPDADIKRFLRKEKFDAFLLPDEMKQGFTKFSLEWTVQLHPIAADQSALVVKLGGFGGLGTVSTALKVADALAPSVALSAATSAMPPLDEPAFTAIAAMAFDDDFAADSDGVGSVPPGGPGTATAGSGTVRSAIDRQAAILEALRPHAGKRVMVDDWSDTKKVDNIVAKVAKGVDASALIGYIDTGLRAKGKSGFAFTADRLHVNDIGGSFVADYTDITTFRVDGDKVHLACDGAEPVTFIMGNDTAVIVGALRTALGR